MKKTFQVTLVREGSMCFIPVPFEPRAVFGKVRAPVRVSIAGHVYRSTISSMGNGPCVPLRRSNREAAGLEGDETLRVTLELDTAPREVEVPADLKRALRAANGAFAAWQALSYSHRREHVEAIEGAKRPETRARRVEAAVRMATEAIAKTPRASAKRAPAKKTPAKKTPAKQAPAKKAPRPVETSADARPRLNADWHRAHRMPKNPTEAQRLDWHEAHAAHCACREIPPKLAALLAARRAASATSATSAASG